MPNWQSELHSSTLGNYATKTGRCKCLNACDQNWRQIFYIVVPWGQIGVARDERAWCCSRTLVSGVAHVSWSNWSALIWSSQLSVLCDMIHVSILLQWCLFCFWRSSSPTQNIDRKTSCHEHDIFWPNLVLLGLLAPWTTHNERYSNACTCWEESYSQVCTGRERT